MVRSKLNNILIILFTCINLVRCTTTPKVTYITKNDEITVKVIKGTNKQNLAVGGTFNSHDPIITGEHLYPTPFVLKNLGLSSFTPKADLRHITLDDNNYELVATSQYTDLEERHLKRLFNLALDSLKGKKVLSLGEGSSGLMPFMRNHGIDAYGLDLVYDQEISNIESDVYGIEFLKSYIKKYKQFLFSGDATNLYEAEPLGTPSVSLKNSEVFDMVVSHMLFSYLDSEGMVKMITGGLRALKKGGTLRYAFYNPIDAERFGEFLSTIHSNLEMLQPQLKYQFYYLKRTAGYARNSKRKTDSFDRQTFRKLVRKEGYISQGELPENLVGLLIFTKD